MNRRLRIALAVTHPKPKTPRRLTKNFARLLGRRFSRQIYTTTTSNTFNGLLMGLQQEHLWSGGYIKLPDGFEVDATVEKR